tara:strand:- start:4872 stop:6173 length:1302 start_codon:yes stop_codon:yes gene_type:complete
MNKIGLIIQREFSTRVRKKSFIIMTILGPILSVALFVLPAYLATLPGEEKVVLVLDKVHLMDNDRGKEGLKFEYLNPKNFDLVAAKEILKETGKYGLLYIPDGGNMDPDWIRKKATLYTEGDANLGTVNYIENRLASYIQLQKLKLENVDPEAVKRSRTVVNLNTINIEEKEEKASAAELKMGIGYVSGFMIYIFVFLYGAQIMRGVIEEKTSRIVEVMISSVKPFELMLGKILGLAGVALLQFLIWLIFGGLMYFLATTFILGDALDAANISQENAGNNDMMMGIINSIDSINFPAIIGSFLFFFIFGYLLYAALFAAIGSAVDKESDTQQFMLPISLPLIAAIIVLVTALDKPDGPIAFWFSMIPLTSPVVMMARIPFGVPVWEIVLSMSLLVITFLFTTWMAGKIYRTGILMYGKKPTFRELIKWIRYKG